MSWAAVIAGGVSLTTAYLGNKSKQSAAKKAGAGGSIKNASKALAKYDLGSVPNAAYYHPVDFNEDQRRQVIANRDTLPLIKQLAGSTNNFITKDALTRANSLIPDYQKTMGNLGSAANSLSQGQLPFDDVMKIIGGRNESSASMNTPGLGGPATLRDLGLSRMDAINQGTGLLGKMVGMAEQISPRSSYMNPQQMMLNPADRIKNDMTQNTLIQQSEQNANNLAAQADPNDLAQAQLVTGGALMGGGGGAKAPGMDWGSMGAQLASALGGIASSYVGGTNSGGTGTMGSAGYEGRFNVNPESGVTNQIYRATPNYYQSPSLRVS